MDINCNDGVKCGCTCINPNYECRAPDCMQPSRVCVGGIPCGRTCINAGYTCHSDPGAVIHPVPGVPPQYQPPQYQPPQYPPVPGPASCPPGTLGAGQSHPPPPPCNPQYIPNPPPCNPQYIPPLPGSVGSSNGGNPVGYSPDNPDCYFLRDVSATLVEYECTDPVSGQRIPVLFDKRVHPYWADTAPSVTTLAPLEFRLTVNIIDATVDTAFCHAETRMTCNGITALVADVNRIWAKAGIKFRVVRCRTVTGLEQPADWEGTPDAQEFLYDRGELFERAVDLVNIFVVPVHYKPGVMAYYAATACGDEFVTLCEQRNRLPIQNGMPYGADCSRYQIPTLGNTFAHELGHYFGLDDLEGSATRSNLMHAFDDPSQAQEYLTDSQITDVRDNAETRLSNLPASTRSGRSAPPKVCTVDNEVVIRIEYPKPS